MPTYCQSTPQSWLFIILYIILYIATVNIISNVHIYVYNYYIVIILKINQTPQQVLYAHILSVHTPGSLFFLGICVIACIWLDPLLSLRGLVGASRYEWNCHGSFPSVKWHCRYLCYPQHLLLWNVGPTCSTGLPSASGTQPNYRIFRALSVIRRPLIKWSGSYQFP